MTELEQQLTTALTALSKQYEAEMEQQQQRERRSGPERDYGPSR